MRKATLNHQAEEFYVATLGHLLRSGVPFMVGGAYAMREYGGIFRDTKDLDVFCKPGDYPRVLGALAAEGVLTQVTQPWWIAKAFRGPYFVDVIFGSGNNRCPVDDLWFRHARRVTVFEVEVMLIPPEEMIWSKAFVQDRFRFDGADIAHILRRLGPSLDWRRLLERMGEDWEVLLAHLINFRFTYPAERDSVPGWVLHELCARLHRQLAEPASPGRLCRGTLLTPHDYRIDVSDWGYLDARPDRSGPNRFP